MTRMEELEALQQELAQTPPALAGTVERARKQARKCLWKKRVFGVPIASAAALFAVFVVLVNVYVPFAYACSNVPGLKQLALAVTFNPSLQEALEHDYVQPVVDSQSDGTFTVTVDAIIADQKQVNVFYRIESDVYPQFNPGFRFTNGDGSDLSNYATSSGGGRSETNEVNIATLDFPGEETVPPQLQFHLYISSATRAETGIIGEWETFDETDHAFVFDLPMNNQDIQRGESYEIGQWIELDGQRILLESAEIYPTHIRIHLQEDEDNTAWLKGLDFCLRDENGKATERIRNGITATGDETPSMSTLRHNSSYFWESEHLTLEITGATWLDKDRQTTEFDITAGKALGPLPEGVQLGTLYRQGRHVEVAFLAGQPEGYDDTHIITYQLCGQTYYAPDGTEYTINGLSSGIGSYPLPGGKYQELPEGMFAEQFTLEDYPYDTVILSWVFTRTAAYDTPVIIKIK